MPRVIHRSPLELRFLGEIAVVRGGRRVALPRSRKTRALLAYLALNPRPHRRERLCGLLWDVTDDPRAALRWSLSKLRGVLDEPGEQRLRAEGDTIAFAGDSARVDLAWARSEVAAGTAGMPPERLAAVAAVFRGELCEGLELTDFPDFQAWCVSERESARALHAEVLRALIARLDGDPEAALPHARAFAGIAPLDEEASVHLVRLLAASGRREEAQRQHDIALERLREAGIAPSGELEGTWRRARREAPAPASTAPPTPPDAGASPEPGESSDVFPLPRLPRRLPIPQPATRYARSGDVSVAYQVFGEGPDLVLIPGWISHVEQAWEEPSFAAFLRRLRSFSRVLLFDRRGTGLSDRVAKLPTLEQRMDDIRAVMDAAGSERAAIFGISEGGPLGMLFAATYPERTTVLALYGTFARGSWHRDYPWRWTPEQWDRALDTISREWGTGRISSALAPSIADDPRKVESWGRFERMAVSPGGAQTLFRMLLACDVRHVLPTIHAPTVVLQRAGDVITSAPGARWIAEHVPGARYVEFPGADHFAWIGDFDPILDVVQELVTGAPPEPHRDRVLATVLFVDIVGSTALLAEIGDRAWRDLLERFRKAVRTELARHRGTEVTTAGDSFLATFDGPARAVQCAVAIGRAVQPLDLVVRAGLHTGECEVVEGQVAGLAVHIAARVADAADPGEVLVSSTVKDLVAGSGIAFSSRGTHTLAGVPDEWILLRVEQG